MKDHPVSPNILSYWKWVCSRDWGGGGEGSLGGNRGGRGFPFHLEQGLMPPWARFDSFCCEKGIAFEEEEDILKVIYKKVYCKLI